MLDFLRLLSPRHGDALRPAPPLRGMATATQAERGQTTSSPIDEAPSPKAGQTGMPPLASDAVSSITEVTTASRALSASGASPAPGRPVAADDDAPPGPTAPPHRAGMHAPQTPSRTAPRAALGTTATTALPHQDALERAADSAVAAVSAPVTRAPSIESSAPLSASVVARLSTEAQGGPPIFHISIDRIEVRSPRPTSRPAGGTPRAVPAPQPLGDYLRGKARRP